jgi:ketosteroid isomerase-like protein
MKAPLFYFFFLSILFVSFPGCESKNEERILPERKPTLPPRQQEQKPITKQANIDPKIADEIIAVIRENIEATKVEDLKRVLATIHEDSPQLKSTKEGMQFVFSSYDLDFILEEVKVIELNGDDAKVYYVQFTTNRGGQQFAENRTAGFHFMKKSNGNWKIYKTEPVK